MTTVGIKALQFQADNVKYPKGEGYGARIGDLWVRLASTPDRQVRVFTKDSLAPRQDFRGSPSQNVLDIGYTWARTELNGGEGLDWDPRELSLDENAETRDVRRFWDSKNLALDAPPSGEPYTVRLSQIMELWNSIALPNVADIGSSADHIFVVNGTDVVIYTSWTDGSPVTLALGASPGKMIAVSNGDEAQVVCDDGSVYYREAGGASFSLIYTPDVDNNPVYATWFVKGRFVAFRRDGAGQNGELGELYSDGTFVTFDTVGEQIVTAVISTGPSIVAAVTDGTLRSYVPEQANQTDASSVNLVIRGRTDMPKGEIPTVLGGTAGVLTILTIAENEDTAGTTCRFYRGEALSAQYDYVIGGLQLQREWFDTGEVVEVTANMTSTRDAIWFTISESDGISYFWRFDLTTFGLTRHAEAFNGVGYATTLFDGKGALLHDSGVIYLQSDEYQKSGYLISPNITFGLNTEIAWIATVLEAFDLSSFASVEVLRSTDPKAILDPDHPSWVAVQRLSRTSQSGAEIDMLNTNSRTLALQLRMLSDGQDTAQVTRIATRGIPTHRDWMVLLPVNVSDLVEVPGRMPLRIPSLGDSLHSEMLSMAGKHVELVILDPPLLFRGVVDNVEEPVGYITDRGSASVYCMLQFRGQRATSTLQPIGNAGMGLGLLGVATIGIGQEI